MVAKQKRDDATTVNEENSDNKAAKTSSKKYRNSFANNALFKVKGKVLIRWKPFRWRTSCLIACHVEKVCFVIIREKMMFRNIKVSCFHRGGCC